MARKYHIFISDSNNKTKKPKQQYKQVLRAWGGCHPPFFKASIPQNICDYEDFILKKEIKRHLPHSNEMP